MDELTAIEIAIADCVVEALRIEALLESTSVLVEDFSQFHKGFDDSSPLLSRKQLKSIRPYGLQIDS